MYSRIMPVIKRNFSTGRTLNSNMVVTVFGAASDVGAQLVNLLKKDHRLAMLKLHDNNPRTLNEVTSNLMKIPGGPCVLSYSGEQFLQAVQCSHLVLLVDGTITCNEPATPHFLLEHNLAYLIKVANSILCMNREVMIGMSTSPMNCMTPCLCRILRNYGRYNMGNIFGVTHVDVARSIKYLAEELKIEPKKIKYLPVIGAHSEDTVVPLYSSVRPSLYVVNEVSRDAMTLKLSKAAKEEISNQTTTSEWATTLYEFTDKAVNALMGCQEQVYCYMVNPRFHTKYAAGPVVIGCCGFIKNIEVDMNPAEKDMLLDSIPCMNKDIEMGESVGSDVRLI